MHTDLLKGKNALVTGGAKRIGKEIALALASKGVNIIIHYKDSPIEAENLASLLEKENVKCWTIRSDFDKTAEFENLIDKAAAVCGHLDILINSASIFPAGTVKDIEWQDLVRNIHVNAWVPFYLGRSFALKSGKGVIINLLDSRIRGFDSFHTAYILSKKLLESFTLIMAREFAPGIRVNAVAPGLILPPAGKDDAYLDNFIETIPLKRHGSPRDIAQTVIFLVRNEFITGEIVYVDGGMSM